MAAISIERERRTVIEATTWPAASFSFMWLRRTARMSDMMRFPPDGTVRRSRHGLKPGRGSMQPGPVLACSMIHYQRTFGYATLAPDDPVVRTCSPGEYSAAESLGRPSVTLASMSVN